MTMHAKIWLCSLWVAAGLVLLSTQAHGQTSPSGADQPTATAPKAKAAAATDYRDGQHDFDFHPGHWKTHIRQLVHPLTGSTAWVDLNGTVVVQKVWSGRAQMEEIEADGATGHFEGLTLFLYDPQAHQWNLTFADSHDGTLGPPAIGEFKNGRGELIDQETFNGRTILDRGVWSDITANSYRFEQSYSDDGGKTWEPNFIATLTRDKQ